jgi:uncharacterized protein (TIGR02271 family)
LRIKKGGTMKYEKVVTLYDNAEHADAAKHDLESGGFPPSEISIISSKSLGMPSKKLREPGLWHRLFGREIQQYEATLYGKSVDSGGVVLTVRVPETDAARATSILKAHHSVDLQKRAEEQGLIKTAPKAAAATSPMPTEEVLPLAEEQINVSKRLVQDGATRIRRFVTETPVEAQVTLHEEHARIFRRATADPDYLRGIDWADKTIEVPDMTEEPVVTKSVHVAEEVVIQTEGSDHVRTLRDKVRRQQIQVEHVEGTESTAKTTAESAAKPTTESTVKK